MIDVNDLHFSYKAGQVLFNGLTMKLQTGSITGLLGKNGAGKTTLLKLLAGSLQPCQGEITVIGHKPRKREVTFLRDVYFVTEDFRLPSVTIENYMKAFSPFYPTFDNAMMYTTLKQFGLDPNDYIQVLSHGQKKKFLIAFALSTRCRLLIFDEPTNGLDIPSKSLFRKILAGSLDENQLVIISTHQVRDVENLIDTIIILDEGKVIFQEAISTISGKVCFMSGTSGDLDQALYSEAVPGGYKLILPNDNTETEVDIELLFNAITSGKQILSHEHQQ
jgi:ABC-2 type transport system ATP-binding protein